MHHPHQGEIWLVNLDPTIGSEIKKTRPVLIISNDINNEFANTVTIVPITDKGDKIYPFEVFLSLKVSGIIKESKIKCQQIRTVDKSRLIKQLGKIDDNLIKETQSALLIHLGIDLKI